MKLTDLEIDSFVEGDFYHCGVLADWSSCDEHDECSVAVCLSCGNAWCDTSEGVA